MVSQGGRGLRTCSGSDWTGAPRGFLATRTAQIRLPSITQLTKRPSASMPTGVAPRSAETLRTRFPCGLVHVNFGVINCSTVDRTVGRDIGLLSDAGRHIGPDPLIGHELPIEDMAILLDGIDLGVVSTSMTINATAAILLALYQVGCFLREQDLLAVSGGHHPRRPAPA